jgi:hypothetical protein
LAHIRRFETANPELAGELAEEMKAANSWNVMIPALQVVM